MTGPSRKYHHLESTFSWGYRIDGWRKSSHLAPMSRELGEVCISTTYGDCLERGSAMGPCTFLLGIPRMCNCDTLYLSRLSRLWLPWATLKAEIASLPGQGAGLFLLAAKAVNPPSSVFLCCSAIRCMFKHPWDVEGKGELAQIWSSGYCFAVSDTVLCLWFRNFIVSMGIYESVIS